MANTYYDSQLTAAEIEAVLEAIDGVIVPANNGKVLAINNGKIEARSVQWGGGEPVLEPLSVTANGDYTPEAGVDGFDEVHVSVPNSYSASDEGKVVNNGALVAQTARASQLTQNGTYDTTLNDEVTVNVPGSSAVVQPLNVIQNGTYNPPSGVDGYAPVTVNVSGGLTPITITPIINNASYIASNNSLAIGDSNYPDYRLTAIDLSQYHGYLIKIVNNGNRNYYGLYDQIVSGETIKLFSSRQLSDGTLEFYVDDWVQFGRWLVYDYTSSAQSPPSVSGYVI